MRLHLKKTNCQLSPSDQGVVEEKILGLQKYNSDIIEAFCELGRQSKHHQKGDVWYLDLDLRLPGKVLHANQTGEDVMVTFRKAVNIMKRELRKYKTQNPKAKEVK